MIFVEDELNAKRIYELRSMLAQKGCSFSRSEKKPDLIKRIMEMNATIQPNDRINSMKEEKKQVPEHDWLTIEQVLEATTQHRLQGLKVAFSPDSKCWQFSFDRGIQFDVMLKRNQPTIVQDSGSMKQPLSVIKRCADMLVRPRRQVTLEDPAVEAGYMNFAG